MNPYQFIVNLLGGHAQGLVRWGRSQSGIVVAEAAVDQGALHLTL